MHAELIFLFIMGAFFFVVGIIGICNNKPSLDNLGILLFPLIGAVLMIVTAANIWDIPALSYIKENIEFVVPLLFLALFFIVGIALILIGTIGRIIKKTVCTYEIQAQCIAHRTRTFYSGGEDLSFHHRIRRYSPIWQCTYNGKEYTSKSNIWSSMRPPDMQESYQIFINPSKPKQFYSPEFNDYFVWLLLGILFTFFAIIGAGYLYAEFL